MATFIHALSTCVTFRHGVLSYTAKYSSSKGRRITCRDDVVVLLVVSHGRDGACRPGDAAHQRELVVEHLAGAAHSKCGSHHHS